MNIVEDVYVRVVGVVLAEADGAEYPGVETVVDAGSQLTECRD